MSINTEASVTPEKLNTRKKNKMTSLAMSPPRKDPIQNQYIKMLGTKKYQSLPPQLAKFCPRYNVLLLFWMIKIL